MSIVTAENIGLSFGAFDLFLGIQVSIANDSKIGLIGPNGIGKTSLLKILAGLTPPTQGEVHLAKGRRIGYLPQEAMDAFADRRNLVYDEMLSIFDDLRAQQERLHTLEERMSQGDHSSELLEQYGRLQHAFEAAGGYDYEIRLQMTLNGLGLGKEVWQLPINQLSGGQKTRLLLAKLLLEKPDLLILDEPTNHLDIEAVEWLEKTLGDWEGAVLIVSHDRYFLDNSVNTIWEMSPLGLEVYKGNYQSYLLQRQDRWEYYERAFEDGEGRPLHEIDFVQRNWVRASTHARALGLLKKLTRELLMAERFGILSLRDGTKWHETGLRGGDPLDVIEAVRRVNALQPKITRPLTIKPRIHVPHNSGNIVLRLQRATIGYPGNVLFETGEVELRRAECAALIGPNGAGKTTLLKVLLGQLEPLAGKVQLGASLKIGYFAQAHEALLSDHNLIDELNLHKAMDPGEARSYLAQYLFREEDVFKPVSALSGGERARLALAILGLEGVNFLILDEPTNHLDIPAQEALQAVLEGYAGTILLVSHDRFLINRLATQIWEIKDGQLVVFNGTYQQYILRTATVLAQDGKGRQPAARRAIGPQRPMIKADGRENRKRLEALDRLEEKIRQQEATVQLLSRKLQNNNQPLPYAQVQVLSRQYAQAEAELERLMGEWEGLAG